MGCDDMARSATLQGAFHAREDRPPVQELRTRGMIA
jgi:hypothetical protein